MINKQQSFTLNCQHQSGAVLAISLIILLLLTLIGITAARVSGLEEKMAGNLRDRNLAFQAAETALRTGETKTSSLPLCPIVAQVGGFYPDSASPIIDDETGNVWSTDGNAYVYDGVSLSWVTKTASPEYIIQCIWCLTSPCSPSRYRITARGTGGTTDAVVILQSIYERY